MTPELKTVIDDAYRLFARYRLDATLRVCHCNCCMTEDVERELIATPLREIPSELLAEYTNSAHDWDDERVACDVRHFMPRYFDLIAHDDAPDNMGIDTCLRRIGRGGWRGKWPRDEEHLIDRFFDALLIDWLPRLELAQWPVGWRLTYDLGDVLTMIVTAGGDIDRVLDVWNRAKDPAAAIHMAALRGDTRSTSTRTYFHSAYLGDHRSAADAIGAFLLRPEVDDRIETAVFTTPDPRLQTILSNAMRR